MRRRVAALLAVGLLRALPAASAPASPAGLSPIERRIVSAVEARTAAVRSLLEDVVNINSGTRNLAGVREVGRRFDRQLAALGFATRWVDGAPFGRAGHLVAERGGTGPRVLLIGHLDTVFEADSPFQRFEAVGPTTARGPGLIDMKGGDVVLVQALGALADTGVLDRLRVSVILTGDEEDVGQPRDLSRAALDELARHADVALGFEDGSGDPAQAIVSRRGFTGWELAVTARAAHSSQIFTPEVGAGAIFETARVLHEAYAALSGESLLSLNPGLAAGGGQVTLDPDGFRASLSGKTNIVADRMTVTGDLRTLSPDQLAAAKATLSRIAAGSLPHTTSSFTFTDSYPPMAPSPGNARLLRMYDEISRALGTGPVRATDPRAAGAADISFAARHVATALDGIGLMGHDDHTERETADLSTLPTQAARAALLLYRLSAGALEIQ